MKVTRVLPPKAVYEFQTAFASSLLQAGKCLQDAS